MITGWRHNDPQKSDKAFREEVQKEFERLYNLDAGSKAFDKAVKDALASLLDPKNPNGFGTDGIPGANGIGGRGSGRDGIGTKGDKGGDGKDGRDGTGKGGGGSEELSMYNSFVDFARAEKTSGVATLQELIGAAGSGLSWNSSKSSQGMYSPTNGNAIAHAVTSKWSRFPVEHLNKSRLFPTSYKFDDWTDTANILATHPDAFDTDGTLKKPYFISDIGADAFGHIQKVKISRLDKWFEPPPDGVKILKNLRLWNTGVAWYTGTNDNILFPNNDSQAFYDGSINRWIGHGDTSNWTVRNPGVPGKSVQYDPAKGNFLPNHYFYAGDWDLNNRINPNQTTVYGTLPRYSIMADLNADDWGHVQYGLFREMQKLYSGKGLWFDGGTLDPEDDWYLPAKERVIGHPGLNVITELNTPFATAGSFNLGLTSAYGERLNLSTGGVIGIDPLEAPSTTAPRIPTGFYINDSGHIEAIRWSPLPKIWGPKGDKGETPVVNAYVAATNTLPYGSSASVSVVDVDSGPNANWAFTFNIPKGKDGTDGTDGDPGAPASVAAVVGYPIGVGAPNVAVSNIGTTQNAIFRFDFTLPEFVGGTNTYNNYYNMSLQNIGSYGSWRDLVYNPGSNNPTYIKRVAIDNQDSALYIYSLADTVIWGHGKVNGYYASTDWLLNSSPSPGFASPAAYIQPLDNGDGTWRFPGFELNNSGHIINAYGVDIPIGGGGGGGGGSYTWNAATALATTVVNSGNTVRFLSSDTAKLEITQSGGNITFDIKNTAFTLQPLEFGNGLSQDANAALDPAFKYDPYLGATVHVNNNTKDLAGIVEKGSNAAILAQTTKVYGTDSGNNPHWRPTRRVKGDNIFIVVEVDPSDPNVDIIRFIGQ